MVTSRHYSGYKTIKETMQDFAHLFELWGVDRPDWSVLEWENKHGVTVSWWMPYEAEKHEVSCGSQKDHAGDLRVTYHFIEALQRNAVRGVLAKYGNKQYLSLPPGVGASASGRPDVSAEAKNRTRFKGLRAALELLEITATTSQEIVDAAYRAKARRAHPDAGGTDEAMEALNEARMLIYQRRGWQLVREDQP